jgi:hypothetical protein
MVTTFFEPASLSIVAHRVPTGRKLAADRPPGVTDFFATWQLRHSTLFAEKSSLDTAFQPHDASGTELLGLTDNPALL